VFLTVSTIIRNQHVLTLNQNYIDVWQLMNSHLLQCDTDLYKQNVVIKQSENDHCLRRVSIQSKLLLINLKNRIDISVCKSESSNISVVQNKNSTSCQLRDTYLYDTYMMIVVVVVTAECYNHTQLRLTEWVKHKNCVVSDMRWQVERQLNCESVELTLSRLS